MSVKQIWHRSHGVIGYVAVVVGLAVALIQYSNNQANKLYISQLRGCDRGNLLRQESNDRIKAHETETWVIMDFLRAAEKARRESGTPNDIRTADRYARDQAKLATVSFNRVPLVDCQHTIIHP